MNELVFLQADQALTTSLKVAEVFEKEHFHVVRDIRNLIQDLEGVSPNLKTPPEFQESTYIHPQNKQSYPMYLMNQKGFSLLVMGFTGKKALKFKSDFFDAFEATRNKLIELLAQRKSAEWLEARNLSKVEFRALTDLIRDKLIPLMIKEGASQNAVRRVYKNYVSMIQKLLGIDKGTRDNLPPDLLYELGKVEQMTMIIIKGLIAAGSHSKQIYLDTKQKICSYAQLSLFNQRFINS